MAKTLQKIFNLSDRIAQAYKIESWHVSQSIDAFTGVEAYDITISGSLNLTGPMAQGNGTSLATGLYSHAEGFKTTASGSYSHAEGQNTIASGSFSHAEGYFTTASGAYSHAEGDNTQALGWWSHAEGYYTQASGAYSHAEGSSTQASGYASHAEGNSTTATGDYSHAEGVSTITIGNYSHAEGNSTIASGSYQHVSGKFNTQGDDTSLFIVGNGDKSSRKDAFKVTHSSSIAIPQTQSAAPTWTGVDGEIVPATVSGTYYLYMWMNGRWRSSSFA